MISCGVAQSFIHWGGAILFMMNAMGHAQKSQVLYRRSRRRYNRTSSAATGSIAEHVEDAHPLEEPWVARAAWFRDLLLDHASGALFMVPIGAQVLSGALGLKGGNNMMNAMGLMQVRL
jgi:hypothetical protein